MNILNGVTIDKLILKCYHIIFLRHVPILTTIVHFLLPNLFGFEINLFIAGTQNTQFIYFVDESQVHAHLLLLF